MKDASVVPRGRPIWVLGPAKVPRGPKMARRRKGAWVCLARDARSEHQLPRTPHP